MTLSEFFSPALFLVLIAAGVAYAVICRLRHMDAKTWWVIRVQHCVLAAGAIFSAVVPADWSGVSLGFGLVAFLVLGSPRWRDGVPGTAPPPPPPAVITHPWLGD
jgi:hypothetical protein